MSVRTTYSPIKRKQRGIERDDGSLISDKRRGWMTAAGEASPCCWEHAACWRLGTRNSSEGFLSKHSC